MGEKSVQSGTVIASKSIELTYKINTGIVRIMSPKSNTLELLHAKDKYNRMSLQITWKHEKDVNGIIKFDRLRLDYGDSRINYLGVKRKLNSEGLKICL